VIQPGSVKICSLRQPEQARWVVEAGAEMFGLIFAPTRRQVTPDVAKAIVEKACRANASVQPRAVGVFVKSDVVAINTTIESVGLDAVQLHGEQSLAEIESFCAPVIKAIRVEPGADFENAASRIDAFDRSRKPPIAYLIDGFHPRHAGGQGILADWELARKLAERFPIVLAGGLTPENVGEAIAAVRPLGVDVSSGVETDGVKDRRKVLDFVANARTAFDGAR
jgi:phosphoribosylanthranilate isomerase